MTHSSTSPQYGQQLLPNLIDQRAHESPKRPYAVVPVSQCLRDGFREITFEQLSKAINRVSWWLDELLPSAAPFETFTYIGPNDLRYAFLLVAAQKSQRTVLFLNTNNSLEGHVRLLDETRCSVIIATESMIHHFAGVLKQREQLRTIIIPDLEHWLGDEEVNPYAYTKTMQEAKNDPLLIVHTSGTSGLPKAITYPVSMQSAMDGYRGLSEQSPPDEKIAFGLFKGRRFLHTLPLAWAAGLQFATDLAIYWEAVPVLMPSEAPQPLSIALINEAMQVGDFGAGLFLPFLLRELSKRPQMLETMKGSSLSTIGYLGAPLDRATGDIYAEFLQVQGFLGSTEVGPMPVVVSERSDWLSYRFHSRSGCRMEPWQGSSEGVTKYYELVFDRRLDVEGTLFIFQTHPELQTFRSNDLYSKHPEEAGRWLFQGRADDLVKNFNLTKFNATQIESMIEQDPRIRAALMGGGGLKNPFMLLEMDEINMPFHESGIMDQISPSLAKVNQSLSEEIVIQRKRVIIAPPEKPFKRLGKGTVNRRDTLADFREEISALEDDD